MEALLEPLRQLVEYEEIKKKLKKEQIVEVTGCVDPQKLHLIYGLSDGFDYKIIVTFNEQKAKEICEDYKFYDRNVAFYPAKDLIFYQADVHGNLITKQRMNCIKQIMQGKPMTIVTTIDAFMEHTVSIAYMKRFILMLNKGDVVDLDDLAKQLTALGYERMGQVEASGQFSIRGGIIDIFPLTEDNPVRMELWGDEIDSIRIFDVASVQLMWRRSWLFIRRQRLFLQKIKLKKELEKLRLMQNRHHKSLEKSLRQSRLIG